MLEKRDLRKEAEALKQASLPDGYADDVEELGKLYREVEVIANNLAHEYTLKELAKAVSRYDSKVEEMKVKYGKKEETVELLDV